MLHRINFEKDHNELIKEYKEIKQNIKVLEHRAEVIKKQLIENHFVDTDSLYCPEGLVIATYKQSIRTQFQSDRFKKENPETYEKYLDLKEIFTFLVK